MILTAPSLPFAADLLSPPTPPPPSRTQRATTTNPMAPIGPELPIPGHPLMHGAGWDLRTETRVPASTQGSPPEYPPPSFSDFLRSVSIANLTSYPGAFPVGSEQLGPSTYPMATSLGPRPSHPSPNAGPAARTHPSPEDASPPHVKRRVSFTGPVPESGPKPSAPPSAPLSDPSTRRKWRRISRASNPTRVTTRAREVALAIDACESDALMADGEVKVDNKNTRSLELGCSLIALTTLAIAAASLMRWNILGLALIGLIILVAGILTRALAQPRSPYTRAPPSPPPSPEENAEVTAAAQSTTPMDPMLIARAAAAAAYHQRQMQLQPAPPPLPGLPPMDTRESDSRAQSRSEARQHNNRHPPSASVSVSNATPRSHGYRRRH